MDEETAVVEVKEIPIGEVPFKEFKAARAKGEETVKQEVVVEPKEPEETKEADSDEDKPKHKGGFQKRIDRLIKHQATLEEQLAAAKKANEEYQAKLGGKTETKESVEGEPKREDFQSDIEYFRALTRWEYKQARAEEKAEEEQKAQMEKQKQVISTYNKRAIEAQSRYDDFLEVVGKNEEPIPAEVGRAIVEDMENGPDVAYFLGKHPEICKEMMEAPKSKAEAMAWKISETIAGENKKQDEKQEEPEEKQAAETVKQKSKAPTPITPVSGGTTRSTIPLDKADFQAYKKLRSQGRVQ